MAYYSVLFIKLIDPIPTISIHYSIGSRLIFQYTPSNHLNIRVNERKRLAWWREDKDGKLSTAKSTKLTVLLVKANSAIWKTYEAVFFALAPFRGVFSLASLSFLVVIHINSKARKWSDSLFVLVFYIYGGLHHKKYSLNPSRMVPIP